MFYHPFFVALQLNNHLVTVLQYTVFQLEASHHLALHKKDSLLMCAVFCLRLGFGVVMEGLN